VKTTPFLDSLSQTSKMTVYNAISPACTTLDVTPLLFTFATPKDLKPFFIHKNIIELANDAGYQTVWLSNQTTFDKWGSVITHISSLSCDVFFTGYEKTVKIIDDLSLIPKLQEKYKKNMKQFFVIHLQGSHGGYSTKYDKIDEVAIKSNNTNCQYDWSIHHTDRVLRKIYNIMKADTSSILYYISDHGENIEMYGHGYLNGGVCQFEVPMFIINQSKIDVDAIVDQYFLHEKNRINTLSSINILAELMGYSFTDGIISEVREQSNYVYHVDGRTYKYDELE
jgi:glucan phosphoethanolaminetransferase (alkaline phosphatase superfamily)